MTFFFLKDSRIESHTRIWGNNKSSFREETELIGTCRIYRHTLRTCVCVEHGCLCRRSPGSHSMLSPTLWLIYFQVDPVVANPDLPVFCCVTPESCRVWLISRSREEGSTKFLISWPLYSCEEGSTKLFDGRTSKTEPLLTLNYFCNYFQITLQNRYLTYMLSLSNWSEKLSYRLRIWISSGVSQILFWGWGFVKYHRHWDSDLGDSTLETSVTSRPQGCRQNCNTTCSPRSPCRKKELHYRWTEPTTCLIDKKAENRNRNDRLKKETGVRRMSLFLSLSQSLIYNILCTHVHIHS